MRKTFYIVVLSMCILGLCACGRNEEQAKEESRDEYYMRLAKEITDYQELYSLIKGYSEDVDEKEELKKRFALLEGNDTIQKALLNSEELSSELLIVILENTKWKNPNYCELVSLIKTKIVDAELTPEQEVRLCYLGETEQSGLLLRDNLCCEALCYIADKETTKIRNLQYYEYRDLFYQQGAREWTDEEKSNLIDTENKNIIKGLLIR